MEWKEWKLNLWKENEALLLLLLKLYDFLWHPASVLGILPLCKVIVKLKKLYYRKWEKTLYLVSLYFLLWNSFCLFWRALISQWILIGTWNLKEPNNPDTQLVFCSEKKPIFLRGNFEVVKNQKCFAPQMFKNISLIFINLLHREWQ